MRDLGNITIANVIHRMLLMSSDDPDMRSIQFPYIKRILVQFVSMFIGRIAFSIRNDEEPDVQDPIPIDIINDENPHREEDDYDAALGNPAIDAAIAYESIISSDLNYDIRQPENVTAILLRRATALAELGSQRADLGSRRAARIDARRQQMQLVQQHLRNEILRRQEQEQEAQQDNRSDSETVVLDNSENPWGSEF